MSDPTTPYAGLIKPTVGGDGSLWGDLLNDDLDAIDSFLRLIVPAGTIFPFAGGVAPEAPTGFLPCDGRAVSRAAYAALFGAIGTTWGSGDGAATFNVPDLTDRFLTGTGSRSLAAAGGAASVTPTLAVSVDGTALTPDQLPSHSHTATDSGHSHGLSSDPSNVSLTNGEHSHGIDWGGEGAFEAARSDSTGLAGFVTGTNVLEAALPGATEAASVTLADGDHSHTVATGAANVSIGSTGGGLAHTHTATATSSAVATLPPFAAVNFIIKT
jgi:microcystin-dependent protein